MSHSEFEDSYDDVVKEMERIESAVLETPVEELMRPDPFVVEADATVVMAVEAMNEHRTGCVLVQSHGKLVGIFTERDVLRHVIFHDGNRTWKVETVMTPRPETLPPTASVAFALNKMSVDGYRHIPIVDKVGTAIGVLSMKDIVHFLADFFPKDVLNLPHDPHSVIPKTRDGG
jgi:CBS domain-containing protein